MQLAIFSAWRLMSKTRFVRSIQGRPFFGANWPSSRLKIRTLARASGPGPGLVSILIGVHIHKAYVYVHN